MPTTTDAQNELCDAVARGRLALAEVAGLTDRELEAVYRAALERMAAGFDAEAADMLGGLVALFPFEARYWQAFGMALQRREQWHEARAAYDAALLLDPQNPGTRCLRGEVLGRLGLVAEARQELTAVKTQPGPWATRATSVERNLRERAAVPSPRPPDSVDSSALVLPDARPLPLTDGRFAAIDKQPTANTSGEEVTHTARVFGAVPKRDITNTALVRRREPLARQEPAPPPREITHTAVVRRKLGLTLTGDDDE